MIDDPSSHSCQTLLRPPSPLESNACCLCMCTYRHAWHTIADIYSITSSTQRQSVFFIGASGYWDSELSPLHADLQNMSEIPPGSRYGFIESWRGMNSWIEGSGEGQEREVENGEWTLLSKLLCQSIFPLGTLDESCPNFPPTLSNPPTVCQQRAGKWGGQTSHKIKCCWEDRGNGS